MLRVISWLIMTKLAWSMKMKGLSRYEQAIIYPPPGYRIDRYSKMKSPFKVDARRGGSTGTTFEPIFENDISQFQKSSGGWIQGEGVIKVFTTNNRIGIITFSSDGNGSLFALFQPQVIDSCFINHKKNLYVLKRKKTGELQVNDCPVGILPGSEFKIIAFPKSQPNFAQVMVYSVGEADTLIVNFDGNTCIGLETRSFGISISRAQIVLNRILLISKIESREITETNVIYTREKNFYIQFDEDFLLDSSSTPIYIGTGRLTHADSYEDTGSIRMLFIQFLYSEKGQSVYIFRRIFSLNSKIGIQSKSENVAFFPGSRLKLMNAISWIYRDFSSNVLYCLDEELNHSYELSWETMLDSMKSYFFQKTQIQCPITAFVTPDGIFEYFSIPQILNPNQTKKIARIRLLTLPSIKISLTAIPNTNEKNCLFECYFVDENQNYMTESFNFYFTQNNNHNLYDQTVRIHLRDSSFQELSLKERSHVDILDIIDGGLLRIQNQGMEDSSINYFVLAQITQKEHSQEFLKVNRASLFDLRYSFLNKILVEELQNLWLIQSREEEIESLILYKYRVSNKFISQVVDSDNSLAGLVQIDVGMGPIIKLLYVRRRILLLDSKKNIYLLNLKNQRYTMIEYPGNRCSNLEILILQNLPSMIFCYHSGIDFTLFFLDEFMAARNRLGKFNFITDSSISTTYDGLNGFVLYSKEIGDVIYLLFPQKTNVNNNLVTVKLDILEQIYARITKSTLMVSRTGDDSYSTILDASVAGSRISILFSSYDAQYISLFGIKSQNLELITQIRLDPFLRISTDSKFAKIFCRKLVNQIHTKDYFEGLVIKLRTYNGWNVAYIDTNSTGYNIIPTLILPIDSKEDFQLFETLKVNLEFYSVGIMLLFTNPLQEETQNLVIEVEPTKPRFSTNMMQASLVSHLNIVELDQTDQILSFLIGVSSLNLAGDLVVNITRNKISSENWLHRKSIKEPLILYSNKSGANLAPYLSEFAFGDVFSINYTLEYTSDFMLGSLRIEDFLQLENSFEFEGNRGVQFEIYPSIQNAKGLILKVAGTKNYMFVDNYHLFRNSSNHAEIKSISLIHLSKKERMCGLISQMTKRYLVDFCKEKSGVSIQILNLEDYSLVEIFATISYKTGSDMRITNIGKDTLALQTLDKIGIPSLLHIFKFNIFQERLIDSKYKIVYILQLFSRLSLRKSNKYDLIMLEAGFDKDQLVFKLRTLSRIQDLENRSNFRSESELLYSITETIHENSTFKHSLDVGISEDWFQNTFIDIQMYFLQLRGENDRIYVTPLSKIQKGFIIMASNPFRGLETVITINPICYSLICIATSIFKENSYLRIYNLSPIIDAMNLVLLEPSPIEGSASSIKNLDTFPQKIYTQRILNLTERITHIAWDYSRMVEDVDIKTLFVFITTTSNIKYFKINLGERVDFLDEALYSTWIEIQLNGVLKTKVSNKIEIKIGETNRENPIGTAFAILLIAASILALGIWQIMMKSQDERTIGDK